MTVARILKNDVNREFRVEITKTLKQWPRLNEKNLKSSYNNKNNRDERKTDLKRKLLKLLTIINQ